MAAGRPSSYTPEKAAAIAERIARGEFVEDIAGTDGLPSPSTIYAWQAEHDDFRSLCARARESSAGMFEREVVQLARRCVAGDIEPKAATAAGNLLTWTCKVRNRKVYGDKVDVDATVRSGDAIVERLARARDGTAAE